MTKLLPIELEKSNGSEKTRGKDCTNTEYLVTLEEATEHLGVHALEGVRAKDGLVWAGIDIVWVVRSGFEVVTFVIACENGSG